MYCIGKCFWKRFLNRKLGVHSGVYISALLGRIIKCNYHVPTTILVLLPLGQKKRRSRLSHQIHYTRAGGTSIVIWHYLTTKSACYQSFKFKATNGLRGNDLGKGTGQAILASAPSCGMQFLPHLQGSIHARSSASDMFLAVVFLGHRARLGSVQDPDFRNQLEKKKQALVKCPRILRRQRGL